MRTVDDAMRVSRPLGTDDTFSVRVVSSLSTLNTCAPTQTSHQQVPQLPEVYQRQQEKQELLQHATKAQMAAIDCVTANDKVNRRSKTLHRRGETLHPDAAQTE